jgi:diguanylate cyclase (GGDEF)-like protein/PAS domain S-box-containing protein
MTPKIETTGVEEIYSFSDLVDINSFSQLLDSFFKATGIPNGLIGPNGELLTQSDGCDACALFHWNHPDAKQNCEENNLKLMGMLDRGGVVSSQCWNGLYDYATPVVIEGRQLATLFLGHVLNQPPDLDFFRQQAVRFGFDQDRYLDAIRAVPIVGKAQMEAHMDYMMKVVQIVATSGLARLRETRLERDLDKSTEQRIQMEDLLKFSPVGISWCDADGKIEFINKRFTELFGYSLEDIPDIETWNSKAFPDTEYRESVVIPFIQQIMESQRLGSVSPQQELNITCKDGGELHVLTRISWVGERQLANFTDITALWQSEQRNRAHNLTLDMVAKAKPLAEILHAIVGTIEAENPSSLCSVLLLDQEGKHLITGAAPNLPSFYNDAVNGLEIGMGVGSCGTATHLAEPVIVEDIETHEYWQPFVELARRAGLAACWSVPIIASNGKVLGSFAMYHSQPATPSQDEIECITFHANLAAIAIENRNTRDALLQRERESRTLAENVPINIARYDREGRLLYMNPRLIAVLPMPVEELLGHKLTDHNFLPNVEIFQQAITETLESGEEHTFEVEVPSREGGFETHIIRMITELDESGEVLGVLSTGQDITERKRLERELKRQAHLDYLTGLVNRRHFIELAEIELSRLSRYGGELSLILFDIDHFKHINDTHGHSVGDIVLQKIGQICRENVRDVDVVARFGGEEFVILLPQTNSQRAAEAAERLRLALDEGNVKLDKGSIQDFTASFGVATLSSGANEHAKALSIDDLLIRADSAMYQAKNNGRNQVCIEQQI